MGLLTLHELAVFGQGDSQCGTQPTLSTGEQATCCPGVGWVVYDTSESPIGICSRAAGGPSSTPSAELPAAPLARVEALRRQLEERREAFEAKRHQETLEQLQWRMAAGRVEAGQRAVAAREQAKRDAETAKLRAQREAREAAERAETQKKLLYGAGAALLAYLAFSR